MFIELERKFFTPLDRGEKFAFAKFNYERSI